MIGDRITVAGLTFTLQSYATIDSLSEHVTTSIENYMKKIDVFSNSIRFGWNDSGAQRIMVPNLATFQALLERVSALEASIRPILQYRDTSF